MMEHILQGRIETLLAIIETLYETKKCPTKGTVDRAKDIARGKKGSDR